MDYYPTDRQTTYLTAIDALCRATGYSPSYREIAAVLGLTVPGVQYTVLSLREMGLLTWKDGCARTLQLTTAGRSYLENLGKD